MSEPLKHATADKSCPDCGSKDFTLCQDFTRYSAVTVDDGKYVIQYDHEEEQSQDSYDPIGGVRLMCVECGGYVHVPEELL